MPRYDKDTHEFDAELMHSTDGAWHFDIDGVKLWVPKSVGEWTPKTKDGVVGTVELPMWFVEENELG